MEDNIENIRVGAKVYTNQTSIFIVDVWKCQNRQLIIVMISFFLSLRWCLQVYSWPRYAKFLQTKPGFYVTSTYNKKTTDYMKYNSKMAENRVCEIFNSVLKNKLNKHATEQSEKLFDLKKLQSR